MPHDHPANVPQRNHSILQTTAHAHNHRRRPRRPPFRRVESEGVGVTSSIRPIFMPERASARRADWAPGPGVLVPLPPVARILTSEGAVSMRSCGLAFLGLGELTKSRNADFLAASCYILSGQHGGVRARLVAVGLDLHTAGDAADGFCCLSVPVVSLSSLYSWRGTPLPDRSVTWTKVSEDLSAWKSKPGRFETGYH